MKSQNEMILDYMLDGNRLTAYQALIKFGVSRLAAHVNELNKEIVVNRRNKRIINRFGKVVTITEYWI